MQLSCDSSTHIGNDILFNNGAVFYIVETICLSGRSSAVSDQVITENLVSYLFTNYSANLLPLCSGSTNVTVSMDVALRQIMELVSIYELETFDVGLGKHCRPEIARPINVCR